MPQNYAKMKKSFVLFEKKYSDKNIFDNLKFRGAATTPLFETSVYALTSTLIYRPPGCRRNPVL